MIGTERLLQVLQAQNAKVGLQRKARIPGQPRCDLNSHLQLAASGPLQDVRHFSDARPTPALYDKARRARGTLSIVQQFWWRRCSLASDPSEDNTQDSSCASHCAMIRLRNQALLTSDLVSAAQCNESSTISYWQSEAYDFASRGFAEMDPVLVQGNFLGFFWELSAATLSGCLGGASADAGLGSRVACAVLGSRVYGVLGHAQGLGTQKMKRWMGAAVRDLHIVIPVMRSRKSSRSQNLASKLGPQPDRYSSRRFFCG